jgi:hypothetical protein
MTMAVTVTVTVTMKAIDIFIYQRYYYLLKLVAADYKCGGDIIISGLI